MNELNQNIMEVNHINHFCQGFTKSPLDNNNNNNNQSIFCSAFLNTQIHFTNKKGIHTDSTDTQTKGQQ
jgi:hypothetical protein